MATGSEICVNALTGCAIHPRGFPAQKKHGWREHWGERLGRNVI